MSISILRNMVFLLVFAMPAVVVAQGQLPGAGPGQAAGISTSLPLRRHFVEEALLVFDGGVGFEDGDDEGKPQVTLTATAKLNALPDLDPEHAVSSFTLESPGKQQDYDFNQTNQASTTVKFYLPSDQVLSPTSVHLAKIDSGPNAMPTGTLEDYVSIDYNEGILVPVVLVDVRALRFSPSPGGVEKVRFQITYTATNTSKVRSINLPISIRRASGSWINFQMDELGPESSVCRTVEYEASSTVVVAANGSVSVKINGWTGTSKVIPRSL